MLQRSSHSVRLLVCLLSAVIVCGLTSTASEKDAAPKGAQPTPVKTPYMKIVRSVEPGRITTTVEFVTKQVQVRATVWDSHNVPTNERSVTGDFYPVYLVIARKTHANPKSLQTVDGLFKALHAEGLKIVEDKETKENNFRWTTTRIIKLNLPNEDEG